MTSTRTMPAHLDVHLIQSFPYANLNRDRQNAPKQGLYGGSMRARISSQHTKRHLRQAAEEALGIRALRTRGVPQEVARLLEADGWDPQEAALAGKLLIASAGVKGLGISTSGGSNALLFLPETAFEELAVIARADRAKIAEVAAAIAPELKKLEAKKTKRQDADDEETEDEDAAPESELLAARAKALFPKNAVVNVLRSKNASVAAFGRMLANEAGSTVYGAVQVAHGLSTHTASTQLDFFTAVDDLSTGGAEGSGAGHLGDSRYTSATFYRYASLNIRELVANLDRDTKAATEVAAEFLRAFALTVLPAKASGTAPFTVPHLVYAAVRADRPVSLVGAFERAIPATAQGYLSGSMTALDQHADAHHRFLGTSAIAAHGHAGLDQGTYRALGNRAGSFDDLIALVTGTLATRAEAA